MTIRRLLSLHTRLAGALMMIIALVLPVSCLQTEELGDSFKRTVLVYIAADNNLYSVANSNILSMSNSLNRGMRDANLLVFVDKRSTRPLLLHLHDGDIDTLITYSEMDSSNPAVLGQVIDYVRKNWEADYYGLVLWSHGTGWLPTSQLHFVAPNMGYTQSRDGSGHEVSSVLEYQRYPRGTKAFAWEDKKGHTPPYSCMEIDELADVIPDGMFDYILFDACYMANVEVAYALRNEARYIISSCCEIVDLGFPYHIVTRDLMSGNLMKVCREFSSYYNGMSGWDQMGAVSLVKTDQLDSLARCFRKIVSQDKEYIADMDVSEIQRFDRFRNHVFYDLEDFVVKLGASEANLKEFRQQMARCVPYSSSTPYFFQNSLDVFKIDSYCGLSVYIPLSKYESSGLNDDYRKTEWSRDTGY